MTAALALSCSILILFTAANLLPFLSVRLAGMERESHLYSAIKFLLDSNWVLLATGLSAFILVLPAVRLLLLSATLGTIQFGFRPRWLGPAFRWSVILEPWAMLDVLLVGSFVGYTRLADRLPTHVGSGGWCFVAAAGLTMIARAALDRRTVWRAIEPDRSLPENAAVISCTVCDLTIDSTAELQPCPRCGARLHARKPDALVRATALSIAGFLFYLPAITLPMVVVTQLGDNEPETIFYGVKKLIELGLWPFAGIVFFTSIIIPLLKLVAIGWFIIATRCRSARGLVLRARLHRVVDSLGRWSNVDVMIIIIFAPLTQFGQLASAQLATGAACLFAVVFLTMLASSAFDARLMWDAAESTDE